MSRQTTQTASVTLIPNGYTNTGSYNFTTSTNTSRRISNAYNNADNTSSSARLTLASSSNSTRTSTMYLEFDKSGINDIPSNATINSITANVRYYVNNTTYVSAVSIQLHANTTAKGSAVTTRNTSSAKYSITPGTWTLSELQNIRLYISATHNASTNTAYLYLYGADVTVNYSYNATEYQISVTNTSSATVSPTGTNNWVESGKSQVIKLTNVSNTVPLVVVDNNVDVTDQLIYTSAGSHSDTLNPSTYVGGSGTITNSANGLGGTDSETYSQLLLRRGTYMEYSFDTSSIPSDATINSISCQVKGCVTRGSSAATVQLYTGNTAKGSTTNLATNSNITTSSLTCGTWTRSELSDARIRIVSTYTSTTTYYANFYGADLVVNYTVTNSSYTYIISNVSIDHTISIENGVIVNVTGVSLDLNTKTIEQDDTFQLTATISPSNASNKHISWSSGNTSIATVSNGLVTTVAAGTTTITVTTEDGNYTATCTVTVTPPVYIQYKLVTALEGGKTYIIANTNSGSGYALSNEAGGSRTLKGVSITVSDNKLSVRQRDISNVEFTYTLETEGVEDTGFLMNNGNYLYTDSGTGLRMYDSTPTAQKHWHYVNEQNILWQFKDSNGTNGYEDTSSEYKYYLNWDSSGNFTDEHITSPSISESTLPAIYLFEPDDGPSMHIKSNGSWVQVLNVYQKINGTWTIIQGDDLIAALQQNKIYIQS